MGRMNRLFAALALAALAPFARAAAFEATLAPGKIHEECVRLEAGDERRWHWKSDQPAEFNIHFHVGEKVEYPVKRGAMRGDGGTFKAKVAQDYCWMWTAKGAKPAKVSGAID